MPRRQYIHSQQEFRIIEDDEDTVDDTEDEYPKEVQCEGYTADGDRCTRTVELESEEDEPYCFQHK